MKVYPDTPQMIQRSAIKIAGKGKDIFPCRADKKPYTARGFKDASADPRRITAWWNKWPEANIGIPTGKASGLLIVDLDTYKPGAMTVAEFEEKYGIISHTATVGTGSGGRQYYFLYPDGEDIRNSAGMLGQQVDVRGEGGYVLAPPSVTTGRYEWINRAPLAPVPPELLKALRADPRSASSTRATGAGGARSRIPDEGEPIPDGTRNETLARIAGRLHDGTRDLAQLEDDLQAINQARCNPPLPAEQVRRIARSIWRYEPCRPARRELDWETVAALATIESALMRREWKGQRGKTKYSIAVAALKIARLHGVRVEDGVRVTVSARQLALAAATSRSSILRNLKEMDGILRPDNEGAAEGKAGAIVLLLPPAQLDTTPPTESVREGDEGGCVKWRAPLTAPRFRWSSPARKPRRGVTPGTSKVRDGIVTKKRDAVLRLGKSCERVMDTLEAAGGSITLSAIAAAIDVKRPRDLTRRKNLKTGKGRDGFVTRLEEVGVVEIVDNLVSLTADWLEALDRERERAGEIELYRRDMARYNRERDGYRNRNKIKPDPAPTQEEMQEVRESYPRRRREAITTALSRLFAEYPEYRGRRTGQITCRLMFLLPEDSPPGPDGAPKDAEIEAILDGEAVA